MNIEKLKARHPDLYLYYHDNGQWILLKRRPPVGAYHGEPAYDKLILVEGGGESEGYIPDIVAALCAALDIEVETA